MKLKKLELELEGWGDNKGKYIGVIKFEDESGNFSTILSPEISDKILLFMAPLLTKFAHSCALELEKRIVQSVDEKSKVKAIEG